MSKISSLPVAGPLDGSETIPMVQSGSTVRGNIGDHIDSLAQPYIDQVIEVRDITQASAGVNYINEAAALAGAVEGERFKYWNGDNIILAKKEDGLIKPLIGAWFDQDKIGEKTVAAMLASTEGPRGVGSRWKAANYRYEELDPSTPIAAKSSSVEVLDGYHLITAGGVKLRVLPCDDGALHTGAFGYAPSGGDDTAEINFFCNVGAGQTLVIDPHFAPWRINYNSLWSNTDLIRLPGANIIGMNDGSATIFRASPDQKNIRITQYGTYTELPENDISHAYSFSSCKNITIEGGEVKGPAVTVANSESDCFYFGGQPDDNKVCESITVRDVKAYHARRNIISIVGCHGALIENCDLSETLAGGVFQRVIDLEANRWMANGDFAVKGIVIRGCRLYDSKEDGILKDFATDVLVDDCDIWDCLASGVHSKPGTHMFSDTRNPRDGDRLGVISMDAATGWITVSTSAKLIDDYGIQPGTFCGRLVKSGTGGSWPTTISESFYIEDISADQFSIRVSIDPGTPLTSLSGTGSAGSGSFSEDPEVSALWIAVYRMNETLTVQNTRIWNTGNHCIRLIGSDLRAIGNDLKVSSGLFGITVINGRDVTLSRNYIDGQGVGDRCINVTRCTGLEMSGNRGKNTVGEGMALIQAGAFTSDNDRFVNCGDSGHAVVFVDNGRGGTLRGTKLRSTTARPSQYGVRTGSNAIQLLLDNVDATTTGSNNATSLSTGLGSDHRKVNCKQRDGTWAT